MSILDDAEMFTRMAIFRRETALEFVADAAKIHMIPSHTYKNVTEERMGVALRALNDEDWARENCFIYYDHEWTVSTDGFYDTASGNYRLWSSEYELFVTPYPGWGLEKEKFGWVLKHK